MAIAPFPHRYSVALADDHLVADPRSAIRVGAPPEFGGRDDVWSPEQLLVAAALACLKTTFEAYAGRAGIPIHAWRGAATGILDKGRGGPVFTTIDLAIEIVTVPGDEARARGVLAAAERDCIVARALAAPVRCRATITSEPTRAAG